MKYNDDMVGHVGQYAKDAEKEANEYLGLLFVIAVTVVLLIAAGGLLSWYALS